ncbi:MAG TPA: DUF4198 domain-containing protein [Thermoanaerobaculia bacterium]
MPSPRIRLSLVLLLTGLLAVAPTVARGGTGEPSVVRLELDARLGDSWREVNVGRVVVRSGSGQRRVPAGSLPVGRVLELAAPAGECSLVLADLGPASERGLPDSWSRVTRAAKIVSCPAAGSPGAFAARVAAAGLLTAKTGSRIEIRPLVNPATVRPGSDLPVRLYVEGDAVTGARVTAVGPGGLRRDAFSDGAGIAVLRIPAAGLWTLELHRRSAPLVVTAGSGGPAGPAMATFTFEVPPEAFWRQALSRRAGASVANAEVLAAANGFDSPLWRPLGPAPIEGVEYAGRIAAFAPDPFDPGSYVAGGASGGIWLTESGGTAWRPAGDDLPTQAIGALALDPHDPDVIYAGSGEGHNAYHSYYGLGLFRSEDGGRTWETLGEETFSGRAISKIVVAPDDPDELWVTLTPAGGSPGNYEGAKRHPDRAGPVGLFRSNDRGATWIHVAAGLPPLPANDVEIDPSDPETIVVSLGDPYGSFQNGMYVTIDGGVTFHPTLVSFSNQFGLGRSELAFAPSDPTRLYALSARQRFGWLGFNWGGFVPIGGGTYGLFRSDVGGTGWNHVFFLGNFQGSQGNYDAAVAVHPEDPDVVFLGGVQMLRSEDGGLTWTDVTPPHVDVHEIAFDAAGRLVAATDGGVYRSEDLGDSWVSLNRNLDTVQLYAGLSVDSRTSGTLLAGTQDNGSILSNGAGTSWRMVHGGDGGYTAIHPDDPDVLFVEFQFPGNLFRSDDGGLSFQLIGAGIDTFDLTAFQAPFRLDPADPDRMLYATQRIYESLDRGSTWTAISGDLTAGDPSNDLYAVRSLAIAPSDGDTVYATTNNQRLLASADGGATWSLGRTDAYGWARVQSQVAVDPLDATRAWVAIGGFGGESVLATSDRGISWSDVGAGLPDLPVNAVAVYRTSAGGRVIVAGTDRGVWASADDGASWSEYGRGLPAAPVSDLVADPARNRLVAGTFGRGAWAAPLVD